MVCYFIISEGEHPYEEVEDNIKMGRINWSPIKDPLACNLLECMLQPEQKARSPVEDLLK